MPTPGLATQTFTDSGVNIHTDPDPNSTAVGQAQQGDAFDVSTFVEGPVVQGDDGGQYNTWFQGTDTRTGVAGWASSAFLAPYNQPAS